jgi:hypothetical protein
MGIYQWLVSELGKIPSVFAQAALAIHFSEVAAAAVRTVRNDQATRARKAIQS